MKGTYPLGRGKLRMTPGKRGTMSVPEKISV